MQSVRQASECLSPQLGAMNEPTGIATMHPHESEGVFIDVWRALEMTKDHFSPYDVVLPDVETEQFHGKVKLGRVVVDWTFETQAHLVDNPEYIYPLFSGFGGIKVSSKPFSNAMARLGMGTLTLEPIRKDDRSHRERLFNPHRIQLDAMDAALEDLREETGITLSDSSSGTRAVMIGHSMGGEPALRSAERHHGETDAALLIATIGFGSPRVQSIFRKLTTPGKVDAAILEEIVPFLQIPEVPKDFASLKKAIGYFAVNPERTIGEIGSCLTSDQRLRAVRLREKYDIKTVYGQPVFDLLVQGIEGAREHVSVVSEIERAGHMLLQAKPGRAAHWVQSAVNTVKFADAA